MTKVVDVAAFIVGKTGAITPLKLQKLVYYTQAWSLVRDGKPLFPERIEAWRNGPVCPELYHCHPSVDFVPIPYPFGDEDALPGEGKTTALGVVHIYGTKSPLWLSDLSHREDPWRNARAGYAPEARSNEVITTDSMRVYYSTAASPARERMLNFTPSANSTIEFMNSMNADQANVVDELGQLDLDPEIAKLTS